MPTDSQSELQLEIGHVLFMDVVGYSKLLLDEQRELQEQLTQIVTNTEQVHVAEAAGKLIRVPTGDGMALVFFNIPEAPVQCAIEVSKELRNYARKSRKDWRGDTGVSNGSATGSGRGNHSL